MFAGNYILQPVTLLWNVVSVLERLYLFWSEWLITANLSNSFSIPWVAHSMHESQ